NVRHVIEALIAGGQPSGASEVVNGNGFDSGGGEALGEFFVELEEAAHVGQDDDAGAVGRLRAGEIGGELGAVLRGKDEALARGGAASRETGFVVVVAVVERQVRWMGVVGEAHGRRPSSLKSSMEDSSGRNASDDSAERHAFAMC